MAESSEARVPSAEIRDSGGSRRWLRFSYLSVLARWELGLILIVLLGGALRFHGLDWDYAAGANAPEQMHPDERFLSLVSNHLDWPGWGGYFDTAKSKLNPYNDPDTHSYVYGTLPLFLAKGAATLAGDDAGGKDDSYDTDVVWGRRLTALFDTATIVIVFALGSVLFSRKAGLLGGLLYALAVLPTQLSHFWTMDPYLTFFGALTLLLSVLFVRAGDRSAWALAVAIGVSFGLALACKVNAAVFAVAPVGATALRIGLRDFKAMGLRWPSGGSVSAEPPRAAYRASWATDISMLCFAMAVALIAFRIAQPYAFTGPHIWDMSFNRQWWDDIQRERDFQQGNADYPPFVQFAGRSPWLTPLKNMVVWGLGPALGIAAWVSMAAGAVLLFRRRDMRLALPLLFAGTIFAFQGPRFVAFMRYFEPMYPVLCAFAGWGLVALWGWGRGGAARTPSRAKGRQERLRGALARGGPVRRWAPVAALVLVVGASAWWAMAFQSVYAQEHPRLAASDWIYANVPKGAGITVEIWDDSIPYNIPGHSAGDYRLIETEPYRTDSYDKVKELVYGSPDRPTVTGLINADYVAITSNRVRDSVARLEREYPATIRYYELLDSGELGFEKVAEFKVFPTFLGISVDDSSSEESFTVYDHPIVRIYKKTAAWDPAEALALLDDAHPERAVNLLPRQGRTDGLQFTPAEAQVQQSGGTFSDVFDAGGWTSHLPWLWWLAFLEIAAIASVPWATWLFRALPDRGYGLSKVLGLIAVALPTWLIVAWGARHFSGGLVWVVFAVSVCVGVGIAAARWRELLDDAKDHWQSWLAMECAFLLAFFVFLLIRAYNPDLWHGSQGGEKPMEIAYLTAVTRSTTMPPYDPWFAGGSINYYYMGWFFLAVPIRALKLVPEVAFNLGVPTFAALAASVAFSTVHNLIGMGSRAARGLGLGKPSWKRPAIVGGLFAAVLLIGIGNLDGAHQTIERLQAVNGWGAFEGTPVVGGAVGLVGGLYQWVFHAAPLPPFDWWRSSRVHFGLIDITEFPYWSMLFGDLHPHLMGLPFFGLVIALVVAYAATMRDGLRLRGWVMAAALGLALGLVRTVHTWDFPTALLIVGVGVPFGQFFATGRWQQRAWDGFGHLVLAGLVMTVAFAPYTAHFETFDPGIERSRWTTPPQQFFVQFGVFVGFALALIAVRYHEVLAERNRDHGRNVVLAVVNGRWELAAMAVFLTGLVAFTWAFGISTLALAAVIEVFLFNLLWLELREAERDLPRMLATAMFALAFGIAAGVEVVTLKNDIDRMNTVFKFSLQAWQLFALASAYAGWYVGRALWSADGWRIAPLPARRFATYSATAVAALLLFGAGIFLVSGTAARQERRFAATPPTLNGLAYLPYGMYDEDLGDQNPANDVRINLEDDRPLIDWLRDNARGSPVIAEAVGPLYHWTGRISENTGLPAVIGWDWHQIQQRTDYTGLVQDRRAETARFWTDPAVVAANNYLRKYNVTFVVVGTEERAFGTSAGLAKFDNMPALTKVFSVGDYAIYRVDQGKLPAPS